MRRSTRTARWRLPGDSSTRSPRIGCGSGVIGIRAAASRSTSSTRRAIRRPGCGYQIPGSRPIAGAGERRRGSAQEMTDPVREAIRDRALSSGFDAVGFAEAHLGEEARAGLREFIARGYHGDMGWLAGSEARRGDPQVLWSGARTVVVLGINYAPQEDPLALLDARDRGAVSVYAQGCDYHDTLKRRLKALAHWIEARWSGGLKLFVDTAPVMEKPLAERAGLGWQGKHTNLVSRDFGSWLF